MTRRLLSSLLFLTIAISTAGAMGVFYEITPGHLSDGGVSFDVKVEHLRDGDVQFHIVARKGAATLDDEARIDEQDASHGMRTITNGFQLSVKATGDGKTRHYDFKVPEKVLAGGRLCFTCADFPVPHEPEIALFRLPLPAFDKP